MAVITKTPGGDSGGDEGDKPQYLTAEEFDAKFNAAMSNRDKRLQKQMTDMLGPVMSKLDELHGKLEETAEKSTQTGGNTDPGKTGGNTEADARIKRLEDSLAAERAAREAEKADRIKDAEKAKADRLSSTLSTALRDAGVANPTQAKAAQALLEREGRVVYDEDGVSIKLKVQDKYGESLVDLGEGLTAWAKSEEGSVFLPPRRAEGSGGGGGSRTPGKHTGNAKEQAKADARELLRAYAAGDTVIG